MEAGETLTHALAAKTNAGHIETEKGGERGGGRCWEEKKAGEDFTTHSQAF